MLPRILEPEIMDTREEARDYDAMDHAEVNRRFVDDLLNGLARAPRPGDHESTITILDLGTGTAQIPIDLCRRADRISVVAVDAARHMLDIAGDNIAAARMIDRIRLQMADVKSLPFSQGQFAGVMSNSIVHHLPEPIGCLREAVRVTKPGGLLFFRDLLRPVTEADLVRLVDRYAPAAGISPGTDHQRAMFADSLHAALTLDEIRGLIVDLGFPADTVQATSDRHWTWAASKFIADA